MPPLYQLFNVHLLIGMEGDDDCEKGGGTGGRVREWGEGACGEGTGGAGE